MEDSTTSINYGSYDFKGSWATDELCFSLAHCFNSVEFFYVTEKSKADYSSEFGAIIGLARPNKQVFLTRDRLKTKNRSLLEFIQYEFDNSTSFSTRFR